MLRQSILLILLTTLIGCDLTSNITGKVVLENETPLLGVQLIIFNDDFQTSTETDDYGYYIFADIDKGDYTITPSLEGYIFVPENQIVTISYDDIADVNFTAMELGGFCGFSTKGKCYSDFDCISGGCSGQVCESAYDNESIITTCEWKNCYDEQEYGLSCLCVAGECMWTKY